VAVVAEVCAREVQRALWLMREVQRLLPDVKVLVLVRCERKCVVLSVKRNVVK
jgi:hypothetical protein